MAGVVIIVTGIVTGVGWLIPRTRPRIVDLWRSVRSLPSRIPYRVVRADTLVTLQDHERLDLTPVVTERSEPRQPLPLRTRCERLVERIDQTLGEHDHRDPKDRVVGEFRWVRRALDPINVELRQLGWSDPALDLARMGDNDRLDVQRARDALARIRWDSVTPKRTRVVYLGPGDAVEFDGIRVTKGEPIDLTDTQVARLKASDPQAKVSKILFRYVGKGNKIGSLPMRDLSEADYAAMGPEYRKALEIDHPHGFTYYERVED